MSSIKLLYVTCETAVQARAIGRILIEEKLAACVNILPQMESIYSWEGKIETAQETILIVKTSESCMQRCSNRIKGLHTYKTPCILQFEVEGGNLDYLNWLKDQTLPD